MFTPDSPGQRAVPAMLANGAKTRTAAVAEYQRQMGSTRELALLTFNAAVTALIDEGIVRYTYGDGGGVLELTAKSYAQVRVTSLAQSAASYCSEAS